jgi:hypothetical protein
MPFKTYRMGANYCTTDGAAPDVFDEVFDVTDVEAAQIEQGAEIDVVDGALIVFDIITPIV